MLNIIKTDDFTLLDEAAEAAYNYLGLSGSAAAELEFATTAEIAVLNGRFRGKAKATDVLSFPALDEIKPFCRENYPFDTDENGRVVLGSVVICREIAAEQAVQYGHSLTRELCYLFVHGLLHLLGFDHMRAADKKNMRRAEEDILGLIGVERS